MTHKADKPEQSNQAKESQLTYEDYAQLPDDGQRYELVDGQLELRSPGPARTHQIISRHMAYLLSLDCASEYEIVAAPVDVVLSATEVRQPDLIMIHLTRLAIYEERGCVRQPPDLVVEILSASSLRRDKIDKHQAYAAFGVPEYWIVNPLDGTLEQYVLNASHTYELTEVYAGSTSISSDRLACLTFSMDDVMRRIRDLPDV